MVLALTMNDLAQKKGIKIDIAGLQSDLGIPVVAVDARKNKGLGRIKKSDWGKLLKHLRSRNRKVSLTIKTLPLAAIDAFKKTYPTHSDYAALHYLMHHEAFPLDQKCKKRLSRLKLKPILTTLKHRLQEILQSVTAYSRVDEKMGDRARSNCQEKKNRPVRQYIITPRRWLYYFIKCVVFIVSVCFLDGILPNGWH